VTTVVVGLVGGACEPGAVELTARVIDEIPRGNLRVPRAEFVLLWSEAEHLNAENSRAGTGDWYVTGVVGTCRWIAGANVVFNYPHGPRAEPAAAPITRRTARAHEELIDAEMLAVERMAIRHPNGIEGRPGWLEAVEATLNWAWRRSGVPPLVIRRADAG
jgi:hypothetical protein